MEGSGAVSASRGFRLRLLCYRWLSAYSVGGEYTSLCERFRASVSLRVPMGKDRPDPAGQGSACLYVLGTGSTDILRGGGEPDHDRFARGGKRTSFSRYARRHNAEGGSPRDSVEQSEIERI